MFYLLANIGVDTAEKEPAKVSTFIYSLELKFHSGIPKGEGRQVQLEQVRDEVGLARVRAGGGHERLGDDRFQCSSFRGGRGWHNLGSTTSGGVSVERVSYSVHDIEKGPPYS